MLTIDNKGNKGFIFRNGVKTQFYVYEGNMGECTIFCNPYVQEERPVSGVAGFVFSINGEKQYYNLFPLNTENSNKELLRLEMDLINNGYID